MAKCGVKSVFGIGGTYPGDHLLVTVLFCRDLFTRSDAERCAPLVNSFKETTGGFLEQEIDYGAALESDPCRMGIGSLRGFFEF